MRNKWAKLLNELIFISDEGKTFGNRMFQFLGKYSCVGGRLPLRLFPVAALISWMAESTVVFRSLASPIFGQTSTTSKPQSRPVLKTLSIIRMPSRSVKPPATAIVQQTWNEINWWILLKECFEWKRKMNECMLTRIACAGCFMTV